MNILPYRKTMRLCLLAALGVTLAASSYGAPPTRNVEGVWVVDLPIAGATPTFAIALEERQNGELLGYTLGGTTSLTVVSGSISRNQVQLELEFDSPVSNETLEITGRIRGDEISATIGSGPSRSRTTMRRAVPLDVAERRFIIAEIDADGEPRNIVDLGLLRFDGSTATTGFFSGRDSCGVIGCFGLVTASEESLDTSGNPVLTFDLMSVGSCPGVSNIQVTYDPALKLHVGDYDVSDCIGTRTGAVLGSGLTRTRGDHALAVLRSYGRLADDLEQQLEFNSPYAPFAPDYLHESDVLQDRLDELNDQVGSYDLIEVQLSRFRDLHTVDDPFIFPDVDFGFNVDFHDMRRGESAGISTVYRDGNTLNGDDELSFLRAQGSDWVIAGNQVTHDLPFASYTLGSENVVVAAGTGEVYVSLGSWGAHSPPHTGHTEGNAKADWMGQYASNRSQMTELEGDGDGVCTRGEICGIPQGDLLSRAMEYVATADNFRITEVYLERILSPDQFYGSVEEWRIRAALGQYGFDFVHIREVGEELRAAMIAAEYTDPWTIDTPSENLIAGSPIPLNRGAAIGHPHITATELHDFPGYFVGGGGLAQAPYQTLEFFTRDNRAGRSESFYTWLPPELEQQLEYVHILEGINPDAFRYDNEVLDGVDYMWRAEMALSNQEFADGRDYSTIFASLGGWWENAGSCQTLPALCDELFSIFPISTETVFYQPGFYHSSDVRYLVIHQFPGDPSPDQFGEVVSPVEPDPVAGTMVLKWRDFSGNFLGFQGVGYRLDSGSELMRIRWGTLEMTQEAASATAPLAPANTEACDGMELTCHSHQKP